MPEYKSTSRYQIPNPSDPTQWEDLTLPDDERSFEVENPGERTKVYRVLIPAGDHNFGAEFDLFQNREQHAIDSSWDGTGKLAPGEVGIVHRVGVGVAPCIFGKRTDPDDIVSVLASAYMVVEVDGNTLVEGSLETLPTGLGVHGVPIVSNGLPVADGPPERFPLIYTNPEMRFTGKLTFPHRKWLRDAVPTAADSKGSEEGGDCGNTSSNAGRCLTLSGGVLLSFYMTGVFAKVRESNA